MGYYFQYNPKIHSQLCTGKKITQPNMSKTVKQMVELSNRGLLVPIDNRLQYPDQEDDTLINVYDLSDIDNLKRIQIEVDKDIAAAKKQIQEALNLKQSEAANESEVAQRMSDEEAAEQSAKVKA